SRAPPLRARGRASNRQARVLLSCSEVEVHVGARRRHARQPLAQERTERRAGFYPRVPRLCCVVLAPWHVAQIIDRRKMRRGAGNGRHALGKQHRRRSGGIERQERLAPFPGPLLDQPQIEAVFAQDQANEARMRTERMVEQCEHAVPEYFTLSILWSLTNP